MTDEDLRRLLEVQDSQPDSSGRDEACPEPDEFWSLVGGELQPVRTGQILEHALHCESCREALTIARTASNEATSEAGAAQSPAPESNRRWIAVAGYVAAILLLAILFNLPHEDRSPDSDRIRAADDGAELWEDVNHGTPMPRSKLTLRWKPIDEATAYVVEVYSPDLDLLLQSERLTQPAFRIPEDSLATLAGVETLLWRVEARLASGDVRKSPVFRTELVANDTP